MSISFRRKVLVMGFIKVMGFAPQLDGLRRAVRCLNMPGIIMVIGQVNLLSSRYFNFYYHYDHQTENDYAA
jgi:hypothetical protein